MSRVRFVEDINIRSEDLDYLKWPIVHFDKRNEVFERRKRAVELYLDNEISVDEIKQLTGVDRKELNNFVRKCLEYDQNGRIWGFRALIPFKRTGETYVRLSDTSGFTDQKFTGAFQQLLEQYHPTLEDLINDYILNRKKRRVNDKAIRVKDLRKKFLDQCRTLGIKLNEYPFNTKDKGLRSLYRYVEKLINENAEAASSRFGEESERKLKGMDGEESHKELPVIPYQTVQLDGHKIDALLSVTFINAFGDEVTEVIRRIWLLIIIDEATRVVLGYHLCVNPEYSSSDVLHCIRKSIVPWKTMSFSISGLCYPEKPGYPSAAIPEAQWAVWDELKLDNALANTAGIVRDRLTSIVNCSVNPGKVKFPEGRAIIERFFGILESNYIHRLGNTTGSNPKDPRRKKPEKVAKKYEIKAEELEQLIEVAIAKYNTEVHSAFGLSPLEVMEQRINHRDMIPRVLDEEKRTDISFFSLKTTRVIRGSMKSGKRPHINYEGTEYTSSLLAKNFSLVNTEVILEVNIDDISVVKAYLPDGEQLDYLRAKGHWGKKPHSLRTRRVVNKLVRDGKLELDPQEFPGDTLERHWEEKSTTDKTARNNLAALRRYNQEAVQSDGHEFLDENDLMVETESTQNNYDRSPTDDDQLERFRTRLSTNC